MGSQKRELLPKLLPVSRIGTSTLLPPTLPSPGQHSIAGLCLVDVVELATRQFHETSTSGAVPESHATGFLRVPQLIARRWQGTDYATEQRGI